MNTSGSLFGSLPAATSAPVNLTFGAPTKTVGAGVPTFGSLGGFGTAKTAATTTTSTGFGLGLSQPATSTGFNLGASTGFNLGISPATTANNVPGSSVPASTGLSLGGAPATGFSLAPTSAASTGFSLASTATTGTPPAVSATAIADGSVNFAQMEDAIQKWTLELVEQEKVFLNQMDQVRDWDRLITATTDKIVTLNDGMQRVKTRQQQLDHELDFIVAQQRELSECLEPLEKEFSGITVSDPERDSVYQRAENLNTQLQQMSEDLKGVIEHINEKNRSEDTSDPIVQIGRILNAHMNSLQWVDQNTAVIQQTLDQIGKMRDIHRRDVDSTQNL